jgi:ComF family protein
VDLGQASATARRLVEPVLAVVFPSSCPACGRLVARPGRGPLCDPCWEAIPRHHTPACRCGLPSAGLGPCARCRRGRQPFAAGASLGPYEGTLRHALHALKYRGRRRVASRLANALLEDPAVRLLVTTSDLLIPVPLHPRRLRERGFNQSALLAAELARGTERPALADALVRRRDTVSQAGLSAAERRRNVRDAFLVRRRGSVTGRVVTIVDDVFTTGATAYACARALKDAGAREVRLVTVARVA